MTTNAGNTSPPTRCARQERVGRRAVDRNSVLLAGTEIDVPPDTPLQTVTTTTNRIWYGPDIQLNNQY